MKSIYLSVLVPTYGHELYIEQALNSILMQETQYSYEIIVGEDASPDNTKKILHEYENKYPDIITVVFRNKNVGARNNVSDLVVRAKGKYIAILEGDDYWISKQKIEKQVSFLEKNGFYIAVSCRTIVVNKNSNVIKVEYPQCMDEEYTLKHFRKNILPGQTACLVYRNEIIKELMRDSVWNRDYIPGDQIIYFAVAAQGKIYCMSEEMSAYRYVTSEGTSYCANFFRTFEMDVDWAKNVMDYARRGKNRDAEIAIEGRYFAIIFFLGLMKKNINFRQFILLCTEMKYFPIVFFLKIKDYFEKRLVSNHKKETIITI